MTDLSFMERRTQQLNVEEVTKETFKAAISDKPKPSEFDMLMVWAHDMLGKTEHAIQRGRHD